MQADVLSQVMLMPQVRPIAGSYGTDICSLYYFPCLSLCLCLCCFLNLNVNNNPTTQQWNEEAAGGGAFNNKHNGGHELFCSSC